MSTFPQRGHLYSRSSMSDPSNATGGSLTCEGSRVRQLEHRRKSWFSGLGIPQPYNHSQPAVRLVAFTRAALGLSTSRDSIRQLMQTGQSIVRVKEKSSSGSSTPRSSMWPRLSATTPSGNSTADTTSAEAKN